MCGGTIEFEQGASVGVCDYCGTKQTLPRLDDDKKANLYDRANHFRRNNDFDKAMGIYEQILNEDNTDAEAYWSLVLCRYGIEYVEDPSSHRRIPTVNRAQFTSIYMDEDFKSALQYADTYQKQIYEEEAKAIDEIQKGILEISNKEEPFDVFICYKETDANGRRTQDSVLANDLYHQLTQEGFKVFFSRITLEDKLGVAYEPYIFAALNSSKVMVAIGTKPEYFNAVWVKNEWSRYLALIKNGAKKMLIPAYRDMDPYDLPEEFSHLQAQDMSKLGFMQDLIRGIKKIIEADAPKATVKETVVVSGNANISPLLKRAYMFLEDGNWQEGNEYCEKVLDQEPENAQAYLGKLMAELQVKSQENLKNCAEPFDSLNNYQKACRFDSKLAEQLQSDIKFIKDRNENTRLMGNYDNAQCSMRNAQSEDEYKKAAELFKSISGFKDADTLAEQCLDKAEQLKQKRLAKEEADRIDAARKKEEKRIAAEKAAKKRKKVFAIVTPIVCVIIAFIIVLNTVIIPNVKYNKAMNLIDSNDYDSAYALLEEIGKTDEITANKYDRAIKLIDSGDYEAAYLLLNGLSYKDSETKLSEIKPFYKKILFSKADVDSTILFGAYEQDNNTSNGKEDIEWRVLAKEDNRILVISKYALDCRQYNTSYDRVTWETCSLREWMNDTFLNNAFSAEEQTQIQNTTVSADKNPKHSTNPGNATTDKVFLLSITEAEKYFTSDEDRKCVPTAYAIAQGAYTSSRYTKGGKATCCWWLRSPGDTKGFAALVDTDGSVDYYGNEVSHAGDCVRPVLWINL